MGTNEPLLAADPEQRGESEGSEEKQINRTSLPGESSVQEEKASNIRGSGGPPGLNVVRRIYRRLLSSNRMSNVDELQRFQSYLFFLTLDQSTTTRLVCSWIIFLFFTVTVPLLSWVYVSCEKCDYSHSHPFQQLVDFSESALGAVSFLCVTRILRKYGLKKVLLLDKLGHDATFVQLGYQNELHNSFKLLAYIIIPCMIAELVHKVWYYRCASVQVPFLYQEPVLNMILCAVTLVAWLYKSTVFLFVCVLFRLMCSLQLLRLQGYIKLLEETSDVSTILKEHMRIRDQLLLISHRYRNFVLLSMFTITFSQLTSLFVVTDKENKINFFRAGDLVVCSIVQLSGFVLCLHGAAKITHRAQRIMSIVSQWHAVATCSPSTVSHSEDLSSPSHPLGPAHPLLYNDSCGDFEHTINVADRPAHSPPHDVEAFQQRQALMDYLQFANAGISLYGFVLDRGFLFAVFGIEFSLTLFILGKTILTH
ncbi:unnamed protein product [Calypogeia fissa]